MSITRYNSTDTKALHPGEIRAAGTSVYRSLLPVKILPADDDSIITAGDADRLDALAVKFYGIASLWFVIASVNNLAKGTMHVKPGTQLRIPSINRIIG